MHGTTDTRAPASERAPDAGFVDPPLIFTGSAAYRQAWAQLLRFAPHDDVTVLLEGETGTGKTWLARLIHQASRRAAGPFVRVDLGALHDSLAGSHLFGHEAGAFTGARQKRHGQFASAAQGTIFLDEIGKASPSVQQKLLSAIEEREIMRLGTDRPILVDVRILAATNVPLGRLVEEWRMIEDLLHRLNYFRVRIPPLRERRDDIPELVLRMVARHAPRYGYAGGPPEIDEALMAALHDADWPGNLRELDAVVRRLLIQADGARTLSLTHCAGDLAFLRSSKDAHAGRQRRSAAQLVAECGGCVAEAARRADVSRSTMHRRLRQEKMEARLEDASRKDDAAPAG